MDNIRITLCKNVVLIQVTEEDYNECPHLYGHKNKRVGFLLMPIRWTSTERWGWLRYLGVFRDILLKKEVGLEA